MVAEWRQYLSDLQYAPPAELAAWLSEHPLRAFLQGHGAGEIRRSSLNRLAPPEEGEPVRMVFRWQSGACLTNVTLPSGIEYRGLSFIETPDGPMPYVIRFDTDHRMIDTNPQELSNALVHAQLPFDPEGIERRERFLGLCNAYDTPVRPPDIPAFETRSLGLLEPDEYGYVECRAALTGLGAEPLYVSLEFVGPEDAADIDAVMDRFLGGLNDLFTRATPHVVQNMRDFADAVYRDPEGPPIEGPGRDDAFETMLALTEPSQIWNHVQPSALVIARAGEPAAPPAEQRVRSGPFFVTLMCHCDWEIEHGLGLIWRDGTELVAVGTNDVRVTDGL